MRTSLHQLAELIAVFAARLFFPRTRRATRRLPPRGKRAFRCALERLEAREVFNATYHGGALLPHVEAQAVYLGSAWTSNATLQTESAAIDNFLAYAVQSPYMDMLTDAGYNVGQGTATAGAKISASVAATVTDADIRSVLQQAINLSLVSQPTQNRLYVVYTPSGVTVNNNGATSQTTFLGYHGAFAGTDRSGVPFDIHYAVIPHPGTPNPTSASQGFTGAAEVQTLTLEGTTGGTMRPTFSGTTATSDITRTDELQTLTIAGATGGTIQLSYNGVAGSTATLIAGATPSADDVKAHLDSIPELTGNVAVAGPAGGPFTITFEVGLTGVNVSQIAVESTAGGSTASIVTTRQGLLPTAAQVLASLNTISALNGNVTVTGNAGGPFTITIKGQGNIPPLDVSTVTGGMTASISTVTNSIAGVTSDLDQLTSITSHELAEAVTDPNVNYKTLGWYDTPNNVEIGDLPNSTADVPTNNTRLGPSGYFTQGVFSQNHQTIAPDTTSIPLITTLPNATTTMALTGVNVTQISATRAEVSWTPVDTGASGYRVYLVNGLQTTLLGRVPRDATSTVVTGLPALVPVTLRVEAYNSTHTTDLVTVPFTMGLPAVQAPIITQTKGLTATSAQLTWTSSVASGSPQTLTLGGSAAGSFTLAYNGSPPTAPLLTVDEVQTLTVGGVDGGTIQLSYKGVAGTAGTQLHFQAGVSPSAVDVLNHLTSIPALSIPGDVQVTGPAGGPFTIKFTGALSGVNVDQITYSVASGATVVVTTQTEGSSPTAAQVQAALDAIPVLAGYVAVTGNAGGPYIITVTKPGAVALVNVTSVTDGLTATVNGAIGAAGFRIFRLSAGRKTIVASLPDTATTAVINGLPAGTKVAFIVEAFRGSKVADSAVAQVTLSRVALTAPTVNTTAVGGNRSVVQLTWNKVNAAEGYRVYRLKGTQRVLLRTLKPSASLTTITTTITGLPAGTQFSVEAFRGTQRATSRWVHV